METGKIRTAILEKAQREAEEITAKAKSKAKGLIADAKEQKEKRFEEEKSGLYRKPGAKHREYGRNLPSKRGRKY